MDHPPTRQKRAEEILTGAPHHQPLAHHPPHLPRMYPPTGQAPLRRENDEQPSQRGVPPEIFVEAAHPMHPGGEGINPLLGRPHAGSRYGALPTHMNSTRGGNP